MLAVSHCLFSECGYQKLEDSTVVKISLFLCNFLPMIIGILAMTGDIPVGNLKGLAPRICGLGIGLTIIAVGEDLSYLGCCRPSQNRGPREILADAEERQRRQREVKQQHAQREDQLRDLREQNALRTSRESVAEAIQRSDAVLRQAAGTLEQHQELM